MQTAVKYHSEVETIPFGSGTIKVEGLTPMFSPQDSKKHKREVETQLFDVFIKYRGKPCKRIK